MNRLCRLLSFAAGRLLCWGAGLAVVIGGPGCQSPADRLRGLQLEFFRARPQPVAYEIVTEADTLRLPLPPAPGDAEQLRQLADSFARRAAGFEAGKLDAAGQAELGHFRRLLDSLARGSDPLGANDPGRYALDDLLRHFIGRDRAGRHPGMTTVLVECLPAYYHKLETSWRPIDPAAGIAAAHRAETSLELLTQLESDLAPYSVGYRERLQRALPAARYAVKDFIGLCESARLAGL